MLRVDDRDKELHAPTKIARTQIRRADEIVGVATVGKTVDARMLEETSDDRLDADVVGAFGHVRSERADAAHRRD
jgi:hypothetical protein